MLFSWRITPRRGNKPLVKGIFLGKSIIAQKRREFLAQDTAYGVKATLSAPRRGNELLAQGIALGKQSSRSVRPVGAKAANMTKMYIDL